MVETSILQVRDTNEPLFATNLFLNHNNYRNIYKLMNDSMEQMLVTEFFDETRYRLKKLDKIYECWCLIKMLYIFIKEYQFELITDTVVDTKHQILSSYITKYLRNNVLEGITFHLINTYLNLDVMIAFNPEIQTEQNKAGKLTPDYLLKIGSKVHGYKYFCMDAKYKRVDAESIETFLAEEVFGDAGGKYLCGISNENPDHKITVFFCILIIRFRGREDS